MFFDLDPDNSWTPDGSGQVKVSGSHLTYQKYGGEAIRFALDEMFPTRKPLRVRFTGFTDYRIDGMGYLLVDFIYEWPPFIPASVKGL